jgi:hypothetical protein
MNLSRAICKLNNDDNLENKSQYHHIYNKELIIKTIIPGGSRVIYTNRFNTRKVKRNKGIIKKINSKKLNSKKYR